MSNYIKSKVLIEKVNQLRIKMKLSNTSLASFKALLYFILSSLDTKQASLSVSICTGAITDNFTL